MTQSTFPLTDFLVALIRCPPEKLARADPQKLAAKYGISPAHASGYLGMQGG